MQGNSEFKKMHVQIMGEYITLAVTTEISPVALGLVRILKYSRTLNNENLK